MKKYGLIVLVLIFIISLIGCSEKKAESEYVQIAYEQYNKEDYNKSIENFKLILDNYPDGENAAKATFMIGFIYANHVNNLDEAKKFIEDELLPYYGLNEEMLDEGFLKDLVWAVKSDVGNAIMGNSSPGRKLYNQWKNGELYKDEKSPYSKKVSWYDEGAVKTKAQEYDKADQVVGAALKKVSEIKKKFGTKLNTEELAKNKEYLTAYIDYLTKEAQSLIKLHELRLALGMREKSNPYGLSVPVYDVPVVSYGEIVSMSALDVDDVSVMSPVLLTSK